MRVQHVKVNGRNCCEGSNQVVEESVQHRARSPSG